MQTVLLPRVLPVATGATAVVLVALLTSEQSAAFGEPISRLGVAGVATRPIYITSMCVIAGCVLLLAAWEGRSTRRSALGLFGIALVGQALIPLDCHVSSATCRAALRGPAPP